MICVKEIIIEFQFQLLVQTYRVEKENEFQMSKESSGVSEKFPGWWWYIPIIESALGPELESRERE